jgi:hypothetical protein
MVIPEFLTIEDLRRSYRLPDHRNENCFCDDDAAAGLDTCFEEGQSVIAIAGGRPDAGHAAAGADAIGRMAGGLVRGANAARTGAVVRAET